ncbi:bifunctional metallophosphatase/5'-nucleotidase [Oceanobacillus bengalensis]|uniref:Bifunctional metallophosphatase/5'-nucleotidase n=1 Tax=Oceanobacillus bengalensis TaxID=1435466 RepID=A0A494YRP1_9BACI|nr:bifunctional UDP-sugar hydrolase/5'-nucleotidase [Oceanobacillus bengalensis]RKQ11973.1 bifunctional metallophosphatase/5'-nucleotidase [Oceanobacillus bengalensis]
MIEKLYFYYTNDLHSNFDQWPRVAKYLKDATSKREKHGDAYWTVDIGDHMDRVHPISEAFKGKANVELMNDLHYDIATIGNNEGITLSHDELYSLYDDANFEVVCTNLHRTEVGNPNWLKRTVKIESASGIRIGVIGLTAPFNNYYELLGWHISSERQALEQYVSELKKETDIIILLSHLGLSEDQAIARKFPDIDLIIGGHTHHLLRTGEKVNHTLITAAGKHCFYIGEAILSWDHEAKKLVRQEAYATDITHYQVDPETETNLKSLQMKADQLLGDTIVQLEKPIEVKWFKHTEIMQQLTNTLKNHTKADCALLNSGVLLADFPAGKVSYKDVHRICPHPINPVVVKLDGNELIEVIRASLTKEFMELKLKGFGFRGKMLGRMVFSGITVETAFHVNGEEYVKNVVFEDGTKPDGDRLYNVATADTFTFGRLLPEIARSETKQYMLPEFLRDLLVETLQREFASTL